MSVWTCRKCTLKNAPTLLACPLCNSPRPPPPHPLLARGDLPQIDEDQLLLKPLDRDSPGSPAVLGRGGNGIVRNARWRGRRVACKTLDATSRLEPVYTFYFNAELCAHHGLPVHENLVRAHGVCVQNVDEVCYLVMECCAGSVSAALREARGAGLPLDLLARLALHFARGISVLHGCGLSHNDVKPGNLLISEEGVGKLADYGLARKARGAAPGAFVWLPPCDGEPPAEMRGVLGEVHYCAPENFQPSDAEYGQLAGDVFSFGVVLRQMATGQAPWAGQDLDVHAVRQQVLAGAWPPFPDGVDGRVADLARRCCVALPADRPLIGAVVAALEAIVATLPPPPPPQWACRVCAAANSLDLFACAQCSLWRPGFWLCRVCSLANTDEQPECNVCGARREGGPAPPPPPPPPPPPRPHPLPPLPAGGHPLHQHPLSLLTHSGHCNVCLAQGGPQFMGCRAPVGPGRDCNYDECFRCFARHAPPRLAPGTRVVRGPTWKWVSTCAPAFLFGVSP